VPRSHILIISTYAVNQAFASDLVICQKDAG